MEMAEIDIEGLLETIPDALLNTVKAYIRCLELDHPSVAAPTSEGSPGGGAECPARMRDSIVSRILSLWFEHGEDPDLRAAGDLNICMRECVRALPLESLSLFVPFVFQIAARLGTGSEEEAGAAAPSDTEGVCFHSILKEVYNILLCNQCS